MDYFCYSCEETVALGMQVARVVPEGSILCLKGDLGAGKTTFVKGVVQACGGCQTTVSSPTFVYLNIYQGERTVYHFDLYRLKTGDEFIQMGFDDFLFSGGICCVEWPERIAHLLPEHCQNIEFTHLGVNRRKIRMAHEAITRLL